MTMLVDRYLKFQDRTFFDYGYQAIAIFVLLVAVLLFAIWHYSTRLNPSPDSADNQQGKSALQGNTFLCENGKSVRAQFSNTQAHIALSDGREMTLPQTGFDSLRKYSNPDNSFTFWSNSRSTFVSENGIATYANCAPKTE